MKEYIEREAAISTAIDAVDEWDGGPNRSRWVKINNAMEALPAADVREVVRGEWVPDYDYAEYDFDGITPLSEPKKFQDGWQCSLCGQYAPSKANYCPNCGADMREENDG